MSFLPMDQMKVDVKVAYRLIELGLFSDPDEIPHDPEFVAEIDADFEEWLEQEKKMAVENALKEIKDQLWIERFNVRGPDSFYSGIVLSYHRILELLEKRK